MQADAEERGAGGGGGSAGDVERGRRVGAVLTIAPQLLLGGVPRHVVLRVGAGDLGRVRRGARAERDGGGERADSEGSDADAAPQFGAPRAAARRRRWCRRSDRRGGGGGAGGRGGGFGVGALFGARRVEERLVLREQ